MFFAHRLIFGGTAGDGSRFSCFALLDLFSAVPRASAPIFMFGAPELIFGGSEGVGSSFHVSRSRTQFWRYRGRRVPFSCFALPNSFSAVPRVLGPVFLFCSPGLIFGGSEGVRCSFHVLRSQTFFRRYRGCRVAFSCFTLPESFSAVPKASVPVFMFFAPGLIFDGSESIASSFHVLSSRTRFRWNHGRRVPFSCLALSDSFSAVPRASGPVFMFCALRLVFDDRGVVGVGSLFHVWRSRTRFRRYRGR
jgi:hypothetical protein